MFDLKLFGQKFRQFLYYEQYFPFVTKLPVQSFENVFCNMLKSDPDMYTILIHLFAHHELNNELFFKKKVSSQHEFVFHFLK